MRAHVRVRVHAYRPAVCSQCWHPTIFLFFFYYLKQTPVCGLIVGTLIASLACLVSHHSGWAMVSFTEKATAEFAVKMPQVTIRMHRSFTLSVLCMYMWLLSVPVRASFNVLCPYPFKASIQSRAACGGRVCRNTCGTQMFLLLDTLCALHCVAALPLN